MKSNLFLGIAILISLATIQIIFSNSEISAQGIAEVGEIEISAGNCNYPTDRYFLTISEFNPQTNNYAILEEISDTCQNFPITASNVPYDDYIISILNGNNGYTDNQLISVNTSFIAVTVSPVVQTDFVEISVPANNQNQNLEIRYQNISEDKTGEAFWKTVGSTGTESIYLETGNYVVAISDNDKEQYLTINSSDSGAWPDFSQFVSIPPPDNIDPNLEWSIDNISILFSDYEGNPIKTDENQLRLLYDSFEILFQNF